jgi:hypothetical protein
MRVRLKKEKRERAVLFSLKPGFIILTMRRETEDMDLPIRSCISKFFFGEGVIYYKLKGEKLWAKKNLAQRDSPLPLFLRNDATNYDK